MKIALNANLDFAVWQFRKELIRNLLARGFEVCVISPPGEYVGALEGLGARHIAVELDRFFDPMADIRLMLSYYRVFRAERFDIVHNLSIKPNIYGTFAAKLVGIPRVVGLVPGLGSIYTDCPGLRQRLLRSFTTSLYALAFRMNARVWFQNGDDLEFFVSAGVIDRHKAVLIKSSGIDLCEYSMEALDSQKLMALRYELGIDDPTLLVTMLSRAYWSKGVSEFLAAAEALATRHCAKFILVGPTDRTSQAVSESLLRQHESDTFRWLGFRKDAKELLAISDIVVLPSYYREGVPRSLLEAMALEKPIITTDSVGCREVVQDGGNGYLVPIKDAHALTTAIENLLMDTNRRLQFGRASRRLAEEQFDERTVARRVLTELYGLR